jgi:hypothetical protein
MKKQQVLYIWPLKFPACNQTAFSEPIINNAKKGSGQKGRYGEGQKPHT